MPFRYFWATLYGGINRWMKSQTSFSTFCTYRNSDYDYSFDESSPSPQPYGSTTPGTPGYSGEPQSLGQGPYTPATPNSGSGMYGSDSTYSPYQQTQSPASGSYQRK